MFKSRWEPIKITWWTRVNVIFPLLFAQQHVMSKPPAVVKLDGGWSLINSWNPDFIFFFLTSAPVTPPQFNPSLQTLCFQTSPQCRVTSAWSALRTCASKSPETLPLPGTCLETTSVKLNELPVCLCARDFHQEASARSARTPWRRWTTPWRNRQTWSPWY